MRTPSRFALLLLLACRRGGYDGPPSLMTLRVDVRDEHWVVDMSWHCPRAPEPGSIVEVVDARTGERIDRYQLDERSSDHETAWRTPRDTRTELCVEARVLDGAGGMRARSGESCTGVPGGR